MPIYDYECSNCGSRYELIVKIGQAITRCGNCGMDTLIKVPSKAGFSINGYSESNGYSNPPVISYDD